MQSSKFIIQKINSQSMLALSICLLVSHGPITTSLIVLFDLIGINAHLVGPIFIIGVTLFIITSYLIVFNNIKTHLVFITIIVLIVYTSSYLFFPENRMYMYSSLTKYTNPIYILFIFCYSGFIFIRYIHDYNLLYTWLLKFSYITLICSIFTYILSKFYLHTVPQYMSFSYRMLMPICFIQLEYFRTKKIAHLIASLIGFFVILFAGARGPVICILITISIYILLNIKIKDIKKVPVVFILVIITRMIYLKFDQIIMSLSQILLKYGIESRTARLLLEDNFFVSLQRKEIWKILIDNIRIIGYGFYGDRAIVGFYAHNIVIELLINFGLLLGIAIIVGLILLIFKGCISNNELMKQLSIVFLSTGFIKLFFSGSYLQEPSFYILIGLGVNSIMDRKIYRRCKWQSKIQRFQHQKQGEITMEVRRL